MTKYLHFDGTTGYLQTSTITFDKAIIDCFMNTSQPQSRYALLDTRAGYQGIFDSAYTTGGSYMVGGTKYVAFQPSFLGARQIIEIDLSTVGTDNVNVFSWQDGTKNTKGDIYDIKFYNGATLVAHYDMSTGTVADQSGNGHDATLVGGTWLDDGAGGGTAYTASLSDSVSMTDTISKRLSVFVIDSISTGDTSNKSDVKTLSDAVSSVDTLSYTRGKAVNLTDSIAITDAISKAMDKFQSDKVATGDADQTAITKELLDAITQSDALIVNKGKAVLLTDTMTVSDALSKAMQVYQSESVDLSDSFAKQSAVNVRLYDAIVSTEDFSKHLPNAPELIGHITIDGQRVLNVYLTGQRNLNVNLKGVI